MAILDKVLRYIQIHTNSNSGTQTITSTETQWKLAEILTKDLMFRGYEKAIVSTEHFKFIKKD